MKVKLTESFETPNKLEERGVIGKDRYMKCPECGEPDWELINISKISAHYATANPSGEITYISFRCNKCANIESVNKDHISNKEEVFAESLN